MSDHEALRSLLERVLAAVQAAADPAPAVARALLADPPAGEIDVLALGKASPPMLAAALRTLRTLPHTHAARVLVTCPPELAANAAAASRDPSASHFPVSAILPCDHPLPTQRNLRAAARVRDFVSSVPSTRTLLVLLSGGASAHLALPAGDLTLDDLAHITRALQRSGADIRQLNCVRKHCELLKGGNLAKHCTARTILCLTLSDVVGDPLDVIASGPFVPDPTTYQDALAILEMARLSDASEGDESGPRLSRVREHLRLGAQGRFPETPKSIAEISVPVRTRVIASNTSAAHAAAALLAQQGFPADVHTGAQGEARDLARDACARLRSLPPPAALVVGGEWTVRVDHHTGIGGPSQEFALACALDLAQHTPETWGLLSYSTDGIDGPTDAAGALVTSADVRAADVPALRKSLDRHDSAPALASLGCALRTGPTGTNVNHVAVLLAPARAPAQS